MKMSTNQVRGNDVQLQGTGRTVTDRKGKVRKDPRLANGEAKANGGVGEGHDGGKDGQPPELVEVLNLGEDELQGAE